ncbi:MAG: histidinol dehydrogenase [Myxococcales bacterium]
MTGSLRILDLSDAAQRAAAVDLRASATTSAAVVEAVSRIVADVRKRGDAAVRELTARYDGADLEDPFLSVAQWDALAARCSPEVRQALERAAERVRTFHAPEVPASYEQRLASGAVLRSLAIPMQRAACYVPGGRAAYPSTVIMTAVVARLAGVPDVIVTTPPKRDGSIPVGVAAAARIAGATRILRAGGAQAVAALTFGTGRIPRCDAIVGPGNAYVTEAKRQLSGDVRIDSLAGPTEVVIVADSSADPRHLAADLVAQAEHDPLALALLVTPDRSLATRVSEALAIELRERPNAIASQALDARGAALLVRTLDEALSYADDLAPEHLELVLRDPRAALAKVPRAAAVFLGPHAPVPVGDYLAGPNHTLPTAGTGRFSSPLSASAFIRRQNVIEYSAAQLAEDAPAIRALATAEGLHGHARSVAVREEKA